MKKLLNFCLASFTLVTIFSCDDNDDTMQPEEPANTPNVMVYGLTENNQLVYFNTNNSASFAATKTIMGIPAGEKLMSIDFRPATGELYALSNASKFYIINTSTANTRAVSTTSFTPAISGTVASIDFNPTVDRIRLVTNTGQNLRLNPETGALAASDVSIAASSSINGIAYTNSKAGATATTLYDLDATSGKLFKQDPPNNGALAEVGSLGITFTGQAAFDISPDNSIALMAATSGSQNNLYTVDLNNGKAKNIGTLSQKVIDLAIPTNPVAYAIDNANALQIFDPTNPVPVTKPITGLQAGENIVGLDFRPLNGQLYALGNSSRIYTITVGATTATATQVGAPLPTPLTGTEFGFDFNPVVDKIRVVSNAGQNLRLDPVTGGITGTDTNLSPTPVAVSAAAYTNNFAGTNSTELFVIDHNTDKLYLQNPPNGGLLVERGALGINISQANGFDIGSTSQKAYLMASVGADTKIYSVNTTTGATASLATYPNPVRAFTIGLGF